MTCSGSKGCCSADEKGRCASRTRETPATACRSSEQKCCDDDETSSLCLAVIRESGCSVVLFDSSGEPRTFRYTGSADIRTLCFSTHGHAFADDLLTPCLDEEGRHGVPEESCFCGVETPHLHAHPRDPKTCSDEEDSRRKRSDDIQYLASHILHPDEQENNEDLHVAVSERMPAECNGSVPHHKKKGGRLVGRVQHDDHVDYLVHNAQTDQLHLEHECKSCGGSDVHGQFQLTGKRRLHRQHESSDVHVHFFEVATKPFSFAAALQDLFEVHESDRVHAVEHILEHTGTTTPSRPKKKTKTTAVPRLSPAARLIAKTPKKEEPPATVRSTFACTRICCSAEIPAIRDVLEGVPGIANVMTNVPLKQVIVDHVADKISATQIAALLNESDFGATVKRDGGAGLAPPPPTTGRSQLYVQNICCASEIPAVEKILLPLEGVVSVSINTTTKTVYVDHDTNQVSATDLCDALNRGRFGAQVRHDAATTIQSSSARTTFVKSTFTWIDEEPPDTAVLTAFLKSLDTSQMETFLVDVPAQQMEVLHNPFSLTAESIAAQLREQTGIAVAVDQDGADPAVWHFAPASDDVDVMEEMEKEEKMTWPRPTVIISGVLWVISMLSLIGGNWEYLEYVALVSVAFGIPPIAAKSFRTLRRYQFDTNCLMFFASVGALALQDFIEAAAVVFLFALSEWLEVRATTRARQALSAIVHLRPEKAYLIHPTTQELLLVPASSVPVGALVSVKTGDKIPCDGVVVEGLSTVDESSLTGESRPIRKAPGGTVSGGAVNSGLCPLTVRTTSTAENSAVSRLIRLVEEAQANRSDTEKIVDEFAKVYTPVVVLAAIFMCTIPWAFGKDIGREWAHNGLILIVVACPCALIISTPVSYVAGLAATAQKGVLIKGGASLEALGSVKSICFDKTGTLTNGEFSLLHLTVLSDKLSRKRVLQYLSLMEERASHPVAQAILTAAHNESVVIPKTMVLQKHTILNGEGVAGVVDGLEVHVGNERLFERLGLLDGVPVTDRQSIESWKLLGGTVGYMSIEGFGIVCAYCAADGIRDESAGVVSNLKRLGISTIMLTGDNEDAARAVGLLAGLSGDEIKAKLLPEEKLHYVEDLSQGHSKRSVICNPCSKRELVLMCGDGVNDAPALAAADIGVAMGAGAALSMETSDVTLLDSNLEKLEYSIRMGRRVTVKIIQNVVFSISVKLVVLGFALAGMTKLWAAIASDVGAMLLVTLNAMLLLPRKQTQKDLIGLKGDLEEGNLSPTMARRRSELTDVADVSPAGSDCGTEAGHAGEKTCASGCCGSGSEELGGIGKKECFKGCCDYSDRQDGGSDVPCYKACESVCCKSQEEVASSQGCCSSGWCDIPKKGPPAVEGCCSTRHCDGKTKETPVKDCCSSGCSDSGEEEEDACCSSGCCEEEAEKGCASGCCGSSHSDESCGGEKKEKAGTFTHGCCESKEGEYTEGHEDTVSR